MVTGQLYKETIWYNVCFMYLTASGNVWIRTKVCPRGEDVKNCLVVGEDSLKKGGSAEWGSVLGINVKYPGGAARKGTILPEMNQSGFKNPVSLLKDSFLFRGRKLWFYRVLQSWPVFSTFPSLQSSFEHQTRRVFWNTPVRHGDRDQMNQIWVADHNLKAGYSL